MSLDMYLGEVQTQTKSMNDMCIATIQGMEQVINSIDAFVCDVVLQGKAYDSAKTFFAQTYRPLAQGIIYLCEELIRQNDAFPNNFQSQVSSTDVIEQKVLEQIKELEQMIAAMEAMSENMPGAQAMTQIYYAMKQKLEELLIHLHEFNQTSSSNYDMALQLVASITKGLAEVQSGKGFSASSGTFSTQGLNMEWTTPIQKIAEEKVREADKFKDDSLFEEESVEKTNPEKFLSGVWDGSGQAVGDTIEGIVALGKWETWENMGYAVTHLDEALPATWNVLSDSFINDVINGDLESGTRWFSYTLTQIGLGLIGGKGLDKVSKLAKGTNFTAKSAKYIPNIYNNPEPALAGVQAVSKPVPYNVIDDNKLLSQINSEVDKVYGSGKGTTKPLQNHHYATNKSKKYTLQMENITKKYGLDLDDEWNKELLPHQGRHPNAYHDYVLDKLSTYDRLAKGDREKFLKLYEGLKQEVRDNPDMLYKEYWRSK
ncbi:AHH domain-containing protein [Cytobacillus sp. Hz8]|uniref:AHH domain-containing protein n=1 Tax=Cytobacillus sp. Hz8 TaxID=3347168 RepID=UPI0035D9A724